jgi:hypothetical protein
MVIVNTRRKAVGLKKKPCTRHPWKFQSDIVTFHMSSDTDPRTYPATVLQWRKIAGEDHTAALQAAMSAGGPVFLRNVEHIARLENVIKEGVFTVAMCGAAMKSEPYTTYSRRVFVPTARRVHRGTSMFLFCGTKFPYITIDKEDEIRSAQQSINAMWNEVIAKTGGWEAGTAPPPFYADIVVLHPGTPTGKWSWFNMDMEDDTAAATRHLLSQVRARTTDPALSTVTLDNLAKLHRTQKASPLFTAAALRAANDSHYSECADATAMHAMVPCIEREMAAAHSADCGSSLREALPHIAAAVFVPLGYVPMPRCGVKLHGGVWQSMADLADAVMAAVYSSPTLRARVVLIPSDAADMANVPVISGLDFYTGRAYAYGAVADLLHAVEGAAAASTNTLHGGRRKRTTKSVSSKSYLKQARGGHTNLLTHINRVVEAVLAQRAQWQADHAPNAFGMWRASGCSDGLTLPYDLMGYDRVVLSAPIPASKFRGGCNLAAMRAMYCTSVSSVSGVAMCNRLKLVVGAAVTRGLVEPWAFAGFQAATDADDNLGSVQLLTAFLRSANNTLVLYALDGIVAQVKTAGTVAFAPGIRPNETDVVRSAVCAFVPTDAVPTPNPPAAAQDTRAEDTKKSKKDITAHAYNPDAAGIDLWSMAQEVRAESGDEIATTSQPHGVWYTIGVRAGNDSAYPYFKSVHLQHAGTTFQLLPTYTAANDQAMSAFFAGTRYMDFENKFGEARTALGHAVSICTPTPTPADVWFVMSNFPPFLNSRLHVIYSILEQVGTMLETMATLDTAMYNLDVQMLAAKRGGTAPMSDAEYDSLGDMSASALSEFFAKQNRERAKDIAGVVLEAPQWVVYGRSDPLQLKKLYPHQAVGVCPYSVRAVELLRAKKLPFVMHQVLNADDRRVPAAKPPTFHTVPVVFKSTPAGLEFIGGYDALAAALK